MALTDVQIRRAKPADRPYKLTDGHGLHVYVSATGSKSWRWRYVFAGKEKLLTIGTYPDVSLAEARALRDQARKNLKTGADPAVIKKHRSAGLAIDGDNTFEKIAREWYRLNEASWTPVHARDVLKSLEKEVFPDLGSTPIKQITAPLALNTLRKIEARGANETARRVRQRMSAIFVYAIAAGIGETDPAAMVSAAMAPLRKGRQPAVTDLEEARDYP